MNILSSAVDSHLRGYSCQVASFFTQPVRKLSHVTVKPLIRADVPRPQLTTMADQARSLGAVLKLREGVSQTNADTEEMGLPSITMGAYALLMQSNAIVKKAAVRAEMLLGFRHPINRAVGLSRVHSCLALSRREFTP